MPPTPSASLSPPPPSPYPKTLQPSFILALCSSLAAAAAQSVATLPIQHSTPLPFPCCSTTTSIKFANFYLSNFFATSQAWKSINFQQNVSQKQHHKKQKTKNSKKKTTWESQKKNEKKRKKVEPKKEVQKYLGKIPHSNCFSQLKHQSIN